MSSTNHLRLGDTVRWRQGDVAHEGRVVYLDGQWSHPTQELDALRDLLAVEIESTDLIVRSSTNYAGRPRTTWHMPLRRELEVRR